MKINLKRNSLLNKLLYTTGEEFNDLIEKVHPADILDIIHENNDKVYEILERLPDWLIADILDEEEDEEKYEILKKFSDNKQKEILGEMSSDEITDLVGVLNKEDSEEVLKKIDKEDREDIDMLLSYEPDTAGGIMATEFLTVEENYTIEETLQYFQNQGEEVESLYSLYVVDKAGILKGVVSLKDIVCSSFETKIHDILNENVITVPYNMDQEEVAKKFDKYGFLSMPAVDEQNKLLGIITVDDIVEVLKDESTEDIHRLGGIDEEEKVDGSLSDAVRSRLPWLMINLVTAIFAAAVVGMFEGTISKVVTLATFMPIVTGMGGNAGTQSMTIVVRGIALGELTGENARKVFLKELLAGLTTGIAIGVIIGCLGFLWEGKVMFGLIIGGAMILNMIVATMSGFIVPVILKKIKVDPALASTVFVTTATDVLGFFFFLGLATIFISYLL